MVHPRLAITQKQMSKTKLFLADNDSDTPEILTLSSRRSTLLVMSRSPGLLKDVGRPMGDDDLLFSSNVEATLHQISWAAVRTGPSKPVRAI